MKKFGIFAIAAAFAALGAFAEIERNTNSYVRAGVTYAQRGGMDAKTYVVTNVDTEAIVSPKRDKTDLKVYRKVKDIWRWTNWEGAKVQEPLAKDAPADFLALANSPGSEPIHFERGAWWGAVQFWPNGKVRYSQSEIPPGGTGELSTTVNFAMYAYDETGTNEIYRFGATATREDATNETVVAWDETRNQYVRIATTDMVDESVKRGMTAKDGAARALPPYLHYMPFDDVYPSDAAWYYEQAATNYVHGSCSARRVGGILERNYDWEFDRAPEFVIPVSGSDTRFASVGIANVGRLLTEDFVTSGKWSRYYRCLPGHTLDGVNENGVVAEINVVGGDPFEDGWTNDVANGIHPLGAVRWALDNGTSAEMVATSLAVRVKFPAGWSQNFHYMIADAQETWIVENGAAHMVGTVANVSVMTNFRLFPTPDDYGDGQERYAILSNTANAITDAWFTRCYKRETTPPWVSDLREVLAYTNAIYDAWATHDREFFRDMSFDGKRWWQTVHTSVYDFDAKTLKVCVQEGADWYVFAVGGSGRVKSVNGKVGHVTLGPDEVNALPDDEERLVANTNFSAAVERVSPPVVLPEKWALANVTNASGNAVSAADVGAVPIGESTASFSLRTSPHLIGGQETSFSSSGVAYDSIGASGDVDVSDLDYESWDWLRRSGIGIGTWIDYNYVPNTRKVNDKELSSDIQLGPSDVGAWDGRYEVGAALALGYYGRNFPGVTAPYSLTWDSSNKRYQAKWAVGEIPTYRNLAYTSDLEDYVPTSRTINGIPLTQDITIDGMTDNVAILTNGLLKTKDGTAITAGNVGAATVQQVNSAITTANDYTDRSISSTNEVFAAAVRSTAIETDLTEYGTVGAAILALVAAVAALRKAAWSDAETNAMAQIFRADEELSECETVQDVALAKLSQLIGEQITTN